MLSRYKSTAVHAFGDFCYMICVLVILLFLIKTSLGRTEWKVFGDITIIDS